MHHIPYHSHIKRGDTCISVTIDGKGVRGDSRSTYHSYRKRGDACITVTIDREAVRGDA
jgi:hypothetical protein